MKKIKQNFSVTVMSQKVLALSISAILTSVITSGVVQASDIDVYQTAKSGDITLMFVLDTSGSMGSGSKDGTSKDRIERVKDAMKDLLNGNSATGVTKITDDKIIGLATFGGNTGNIRAPAKRLDATTGNKTHRQFLLDQISGLTANSTTPTANIYSDVASYLMGTTTKNADRSSFPSSSDFVKDSNKYLQPDSLKQTEDVKKCSGQGIYVLTDGEPNQSSETIAKTLMRKALDDTSFNCDNSLLSQVNNRSYGYAGAWHCIGKFSQSLLNENNKSGVVIKTAVVGFGSAFNGIKSYDKKLSQEDNLKNITNAKIDSNIAEDIRNAAKWGVYGQGGWYSGNSSEDVVNSVNEFINNLGADIPSVTTGTPTIPNDELNPSILQKFAYYPQFQPTPAQSFQLWLGNLKKYNVNGSGRLTDASNQLIVNDKGALIDERVDLWAPALDTAVAEGDINTTGSRLNRFMGGVKSKLKLKHDVNNANSTNRKLLTNRVASGSNYVSSSNTLTPVTLDYVATSDGMRGYLMALLGYDVDPTTTAGMANITKANLIGQNTPAELRQVGAVMHSSPVLLTSQGKITYNDTTRVLGSVQRKDYALFGTTQGLLHVVDAETGQEKFAFVPNEMIENQKEAFLKPNMATSGLGKMFYGVDGQWAVYSEYVVDSSGKLTVGNGLNSEKGKQRVYGGLRMGGRGYYALNLDNIDSPKLMFNINPDAATTGSPLSFMGQSWSKPALGWVKWGKTKRLVMFVGGGYDAGGDDGNAKTGSTKGTYGGYEEDAYNQGNNGRGAGVYMFDATTGELLWWSSSKASSSSATTNAGIIGLNDTNMKYSVVSEIKTVDRDADGLIDHLYFGDLGGQVFRVDINNKATALGAFAKSRRVMNLSQTDGKAPRFYEAPAFSIYDSAGKTFAVVSIGTGNRSQPLKEYTVGTTGRKYDSIYNIYDKDVTNPNLYTMADSEFVSLNINLDATNGLKEIKDENRFGVATVDVLAPYSTKGWYYQFKSNMLQSEKVFSMPIVINNDMYVSTFDGSKPGLSGDCGAGVKGESSITKFCMPYGQCSKAGSASAYKMSLGVGITGGSVGAGENGSTRLIVANVDTTGITGGSEITGARYNTSMGLVTQRWYEKYK